MLFLFFKQNTAYEMRISDWSSDVCSSDLVLLGRRHGLEYAALAGPQQRAAARHPDLPGRSLVGEGPPALRPAGGGEPAKRYPVLQPHARRHQPGAADAEDASGAAASPARGHGSGEGPPRAPAAARTNPPTGPPHEP